MRGIAAVFLRELTTYVVTPTAAVFIVVFVITAALLSFEIGGLIMRGEADLVPFFAFHPWLHALFVPAIAMRLWAEERRAGTIELLLTRPVSVWQAVIGKFLAAWIVIAFALVLTMPMWWTVTYLGSPDHGAIITGYLGSWLMAGAHLAIGSATSAATRSQVIAYVLAVVIGLALTVGGVPAVVAAVTGNVPADWIDALTTFSFTSQFEGLMRGVVEARALVFFGTVTVFFLFLAAASIDEVRGQ